ncbi:MAG TPA: double zinc ribbon domain-containing protein, partial [Rhizomicrobium sp.]|nr:double zinc ribbon domain-containing protein [Rhizomicrobium sp.]
MHAHDAVRRRGGRKYAAVHWPLRYDRAYAQRDGADVLALIDLIFPPLCMACRVQVSDRGAFCPKCWQEIQFLDGPMCDCCGLPFELDPGSDSRCAACLASPPAYDKARAIMRYDEKSRGPILALKHADRL